MALKSIRIENFKSIGEIEIVNPQPFSVLVGPNAAGKSNIFAALQFLHHCYATDFLDVLSGFGGGKALLHYNSSKTDFEIEVETTKDKLAIGIEFASREQFNLSKVRTGGFIMPFYREFEEFYPSSDKENQTFSLYINPFNRLFVNNSSIVFQKINDDSKLSPDASNLEKVLKRILNDSVIIDEFIETLQLFIPGLDRVEVVSSEFSSNLDILVYEKSLNRPINKELISDGTYNIIAILTALYQSKTPQFLCIEEPENGLNPYVCKHLVALCKDLCEQHGHYIWLNTHSQSIVSQLSPEEIILVDKKDGFTQIKQFEKGSFGNMPMDEAWLTNTLGGGLPW